MAFKDFSWRSLAVSARSCGSEPSAIFEYGRSERSTSRMLSPSSPASNGSSTREVSRVFGTSLYSFGVSPRAGTLFSLSPRVTIGFERLSSCLTFASLSSGEAVLAVSLPSRIKRRRC